MKRWLTAAFLLLCSTAFAEVRLGTEVSSIRYKEKSFMKETGVMYGIDGEAAYRDKFFLKGEGRALWGAVDYSSPVSGSLDDISDSLYEVRGLAGPRLGIATPYTGLGFRFLSDDSSGELTSNGDHGYKREANYLYVPFGLELRKNINNWTFTVNGELDALLQGRQRSYLSEIQGFSDVTNKQNSGFGQKLSLNIVKNGKVNLGVGVFYNHWDVRSSELAVGAQITPEIPLFIYEPRNDSSEIGVKLFIEF